MEEKNTDITTLYAKTELDRFAEVWREAEQKINGLINEEKPDGDTLVEVMKTIVQLNKDSKQMKNMAVLLSKQKACDNFLKEKGLTAEFVDFANKEKEKR